MKLSEVDKAFILGMRLGIFRALNKTLSTNEFAHLYNFAHGYNPERFISYSNSVYKYWESEAYRKNLKDRHSHARCLSNRPRTPYRALMPSTPTSIKAFNPADWVRKRATNHALAVWWELKNLQCLYILKYRGNFYKIRCTSIELDWYDDGKHIFANAVASRLSRFVADFLMDKSFLKSSSRNFTGRLRSAILERDKYRCVLCKRQDNLEVDHIVPVSRGGQTRYSNGRTLCKKCNTGIYHHKQKTRRVV